MTLSFYAREGLLAYVPNNIGRVGQSPRYIGRSHTLGTATKPAEYPATVDPTAFPSPDTQTVARLTHLCRDGAIWPANSETAAACGVQFVPVEYKDGAWVAAERSSPRKR
jgi:hypothetical protein